MELRHLTTFVAVAEESSFSRAAERLQVVQSAVSAGVRSLEAELGGPLFERTTHRVELTDAGQILLPEARATLAAAAAAREAVEQVHGGLRGSVAIGIMQSDALRPLSVAALLAGFREAHPEVELRLHQDTGGNLAAAVGDGELDFAFVVLAVERVTGLKLTPLASRQLLLAVGESHPLAGRTWVSLKALVEETFADGPVGFGTRDAVDRSFAAAGLERNVALEVNDPATLIDLVRHGIAVAFLPPAFLREAAGISLVSIRGQAPRFDTYVAEPATRRLGAAAAALLGYAKAAILEEPGHAAAKT